MNRRAFLAGLVALPSGLLVPEPVRAYSFAGGWAVLGFVTVNGRDAVPFTAHDKRIRIEQLSTLDILGVRYLDEAPAPPAPLIAVAKRFG